MKIKLTKTSVTNDCRSHARALGFVFSYGYLSPSAVIDDVRLRWKIGIGCWWFVLYIAR